MRMFQETAYVLIAIGCGALSVAEEPTPREPANDSPVISQLRVFPQFGPAGTEYAISLKIMDPQGPADVGNALYQIRQKRELITIPLNDEGKGADSAAGDDVYTGTSIVPRSAVSMRHTFEVFITDKGGNRSNSLRYRFTVLDQVHLVYRDKAAWSVF